MAISIIFPILSPNSTANITYIIVSGRGSCQIAYGPGFDTHRSAVGGRNYEYYSEDGYLAGSIGAEVVKNAEAEGGAGGIVIAMMRLGTDWAPCNESLVTTVLRDEWGYQGYTLTDFCGMTVWPFSNFTKAITS